MSKRVVFLDVDGVLNSHAFSKRMWEQEAVRVFRENMLDRNAILCLKQIVSRTDADIVVSSTWRLDFAHFTALQEQLAKEGLSVHDVTPRLPGEIRGKEIQMWLDYNPSYKEFVILDDDSDMGDLSMHLLQTEFSDGLKARHIDRAVQILIEGVRNE